MTAREKLALARQLFKHGEIAKALDCIVDVPDDHPWSTIDLIMKARLIQLGPDNDRFTLDDAERCLHRAITEEPTNPYPLMELAFYESRVKAAPQQAQMKFSEAAEMLSRDLGECLGGLVEATEFDQSKNLARQFLAEFLAKAERSALASIKETL